MNYGTLGEIWKNTTAQYDVTGNDHSVWLFLCFLSNLYISFWNVALNCLNFILRIKHHFSCWVGLHQTWNRPFLCCGCPWLAVIAYQEAIRLLVCTLFHRKTFKMKISYTFYFIKTSPTLWINILCHRSLREHTWIGHKVIGSNGIWDNSLCDPPYKVLFRVRFEPTNLAN